MATIPSKQETTGCCPRLRSVPVADELADAPGQPEEDLDVRHTIVELAAAQAVVVVAGRQPGLELDPQRGVDAVLVDEAESAAEDGRRGSVGEMIAAVSGTSEAEPREDRDD